MKRLDAFKKIIEIINEQFIICNFGYPSRELYYLKDRTKNFYFLENTEITSSVALGVALTRPNQSIWCIDSDESILTVSLYSSYSYKFVLRTNFNRRGKPRPTRYFDWASSWVLISLTISL